MNIYKLRSDFLTSYSFYDHALRTKDEDRIRWAQSTSAATAKLFITTCEGMSEFEPVLKRAREFEFNGFYILREPIEVGMDFSSKEKDVTAVEIYKVKKSKPERIFGAAYPLSKSDVLAAISAGTGITEEKKLIVALKYARNFCETTEGGKYIYTQETINLAIKQLQS